MDVLVCFIWNLNFAHRHSSEQSKFRHTTNEFIPRANNMRHIHTTKTHSTSQDTESPSTGTPFHSTKQAPSRPPFPTSPVFCVQFSEPSPRPQVSQFRYPKTESLFIPLTRASRFFRTCQSLASDDVAHRTPPVQISCFCVVTGSAPDVCANGGWRLTLCVTFRRLREQGNTQLLYAEVCSLQNVL